MWYGLAAWRLGDQPFALKKFDEAAKLNPKDEMINDALTMAKKGETFKFQLETEDVADNTKKPDSKEPDKNAPKPTKKVDRMDDE